MGGSADVSSRNVGKVAIRVVSAFSSRVAIENRCRKGAHARAPLTADTQPKLNAEAGSAAAGALDRGVLELEARSLECLHVVHGAILQIHRGGRVQEHLQVIVLVDLVHHAGLDATSAMYLKDC